MKYVIYFFAPFNTWGWRFVDSNGNNGLNFTSFDSEGDARTNLTETIESFGGDPEAVTIEVEGPEGD
ncbi:MAG: hypothetical protein ACRDPE_19735 [Solirubrobacterales bacterium]